MSNQTTSVPEAWFSGELAQELKGSASSQNRMCLQTPIAGRRESHYEERRSGSSLGIQELKRFLPDDKSNRQETSTNKRCAAGGG